MRFITYELLALSLANASAVADENYDNTLASCLAFAAEFDNTCPDLENPVAYDDVPTATYTFTKSGGKQKCPENGTVDGNECTWTRKLCVTCQDDNGQVRIRVQSNNIPNHGMNSPGSIIDVSTDWIVDWMQTPDPTPSESLSQYELDEIICNLVRSKESNIPDSVHYEDIDNGARGWGIATTGVQIWNGLSIEGVDPFYPAKYGTVRFPEDNVEQVDQCLAHP